jgi:bla regulator protein blaR1
MTNFFSSLWPAAANHLWQSTLFAATAAVLTVLLRKHSARTRYCLWLAASLKFLVPFSLLVKLGTHLSWPHASAQPSTPALYSVLQDISQPFAPPSLNLPPATPLHSAVSYGLPHMWQIMAAIWLAGFLSVLILWTVRWFRITSAARHAEPLSDGREIAALRRIERIFGMRIPIAFLQSRASLEPGIFGILRPVLIWPEGISQHLDDSQLESVLAHEVWHVRRRDNLFAAIHMLVEAVFWFYPLVWWIGARLIDERERACDEEVVALGNDRQVYAESILKVCEFCLGSPLPCVSGVTGADLKQRMVHIMNDRILHTLGPAKKLLLTTAALAAIAIPVAFGLLNPTAMRAHPQSENSASAPSFSSVSIRPSATVASGPAKMKVMFELQNGNFAARGIDLQMLIRLAYHVQDTQIAGGPDWLTSQKYDIDAKLDDTSAKALQNRNSGEPELDSPRLLQSLLADRFKLALHSEGRSLPVYDLVLDSNGPKLKDAGDVRMLRMGPGQLTSGGIPIELLAQDLAMRLGSTVIDKTGLKGNYAFSLHWTPDREELERLKQQGVSTTGTGSSAEPSGPPIFTALQEQLGLKLEPRTETVQVLAIDHAEKPTN